MKHIRPSKRDGRSVYSQTKQTKCPYCQSQSTLDVEDIGWVPGPLNRNTYICLGCCEDIYSVCASDEYDTNPYRDLVEEAAKVEKVSTRMFRTKCIEQQIDAGNERLNRGEMDIQQRIQPLVSLLDKLKKAVGP
ncbi:hypothetical protein SH467x_003392 [Pirellulaceae bacterium SH467]